MDNLIIAAKDGGAANYLIPIAKAVSHPVLALEGVAVDRFAEAGFDKPAFRGKLTPSTLGFAAGRFLDEHAGKNPVVLCGCGSPNNIEGRLLSEANWRGYKTAMVVDAHGSAKIRCPHEMQIPNILFVPDDFAAQLERRKYPDTTNIIIVGNPNAVRPACDKLSDIEERASKVGHLILYCADNQLDVTAAELRLIGECLAGPMKEADCEVLIHFHPKNEVFPEWLHILNEINDRRLINCGQMRSMATLASLGPKGIFITGYSQLLTTAALIGLPAISLQTPATMAGLKLESGIVEVPEVALGVADSISEAFDLREFGPVAPSLVAEKLRPYDPEIILRALESL